MRLGVSRFDRAGQNVCQYPADCLLRLGGHLAVALWRLDGLLSTIANDIQIFSQTRLNAKTFSSFSKKWKLFEAQRRKLTCY
jgi:hypothetical protein